MCQILFAVCYMNVSFSLLNKYYEYLHFSYEKTEPRILLPGHAAPW